MMSSEDSQHELIHWQVGQPTVMAELVMPTLSLVREDVPTDAVNHHCMTLISSKYLL